MQPTLDLQLRSAMKRMPGPPAGPTDSECTAPEAAFFASATAIVVTDLDGCIVAVNPTYEAMTGKAASALCGTLLRCETANGAPLPGCAASPVARWEGEVVAVDGGGKLRNHWMTLATVSHAPGRSPLRVATFTDISALAQERAVLQHQALHDPLTGLPNRRLFTGELSRSLARAVRHAQPLALLLLDVDHFKDINDTHGHAVGDAVLCKIGRCLKQAVRAEDLVARLGGDEFAVLLENVVHAADAASTAATLLAAVEGIRVATRTPLNVTASIGIAMFPDDATSAAKLERRADAAMYLAKMRGRARFALIERAWSQAAVVGG
jgi:diguanylate cyclase (GGDEF)-like protein